MRQKAAGRQSCKPRPQFEQKKIQPESEKGENHPPGNRKTHHGLHWMHQSRKGRENRLI
jgi:hypothetical protein